MKSVTHRLIWLLSVITAFTAMLGLTSNNVHAADPTEVAKQAKDGHGTPCGGGGL